MREEFVHLCCLSDRSIGTGLIKPSQLVEEYARRGATAACITDYGSMSAAIQLHKCCRSADIKPIYGLLVNLVDDKAEKKQGHHNLCLLANNLVGFQNLTRIATIGAMYFYYVPRVDLETLRQYTEGLSVLTCGTRGLGAKQLFSSTDADLQPLFDVLTPLYGGHIYLELQDTPTDAQRKLNEAIIDYAEANGWSENVVATGMPHYLHESDADLHRSLYTARNYRSSGSGYPVKGPAHLKTRQEMIDSFTRQYRGQEEPYMRAITNADCLVNRIEDFDLREGVKIPRYAG